MAFSRSSRRARGTAQKDTAWSRAPRQELSSKEKTCYQCGGPHLVRDCPTASDSKKCYTCGGSHLARDCSLPYKTDSFSGGGQRLARDRKEARNDLGLKPGDWMCPSCGDHQFARNTACRMCGAEKPEGVGGNSIKDRPDMSSSSTEDDDAVVSKNERPVVSTKARVVRPDSVNLPKKHGADGKPSWADIVDEEEGQEEASRPKTPSTSTSAGVSDASSQVGDSSSEDCVLPGSQSDLALFAAPQQFWEEPMTFAAGNELANDPENFDEAVEVDKAAAMNHENQAGGWQGGCNGSMMCGTTWPELWWPTYPEMATLPAMQQCPNGHQLVEGVITALDNYICDGCGNKVLCDQHVMECSPCNWGLCKMFCCGQATVLNPGDRVKSLCAEPSWNPRPLQIGDEGMVVENLPDACVSVEFNGVTGWLYATNLQKLEAEDYGLWSAGGVETPVGQTVQDNIINLGA